MVSVKGSSAWYAIFLTWQNSDDCTLIWSSGTLAEVCLIPVGGELVICKFNQSDTTMSRGLSATTASYSAIVPHFTDQAERP